MIRRSFLPLAFLALPLLLAACEDHGPPDPSAVVYYGAWGYGVHLADEGLLEYERLPDGAPDALFEIFANGRLRYRHTAYMGGCFPSSVECAGIWYLDTDDLLCIEYAFGMHVYCRRFAVVYVDEFVMLVAELH